MNHFTGKSHSSKSKVPLGYSEKISEPMTTEEKVNHVENMHRIMKNNLGQLAEPISIQDFFKFLFVPFE
jgi:hypothetical protein